MGELSEILREMAAKPSEAGYLLQAAIALERLEQRIKKLQESNKLLRQEIEDGRDKTKF